jgi:hypothetical protein
MQVFCFTVNRYLNGSAVIGGNITTVKNPVWISRNYDICFQVKEESFLSQIKLRILQKVTKICFTLKTCTQDFKRTNDMPAYRYETLTLMILANTQQRVKQLHFNTTVFYSTLYVCEN